MHEETRRIIKEQCSNAGITERQLALGAGVVQSTLNRFMTNGTDSLDYVNLQKIAHYFSLTVSQLTGETPYSEDAKIRGVILAMEKMPEYKKDMLVAASASLVEPEKNTDVR